MLYFDKYPDLVLSYFVLNKLINNQINKSDLWRCIRWALFSCYKTCLSDNNHISLFSDWLFPPQYMPELRPCWYFPFQKSFKAFQMGNHDNLVLTFNRIYSCSASRLRVCYLWTLGFPVWRSALPLTEYLKWPVSTSHIEKRNCYPTWHWTLKLNLVFNHWGKKNS